MAALDELLKQVADTALRERLAKEFEALRKGSRFGLVFEEHLPEVVELPGLIPRKGARVRRAEDAPGRYFVVSDTPSSRTVALTPEGDNGRPEVGAKAETVSKDSVVVTKRFGEPIYPFLEPVDAVWRSPEKPAHVVINADNFHALQLLLYGYEGRVDVIYIDPPYNTGARDWKYNNNYVDKTDQYRHSKWLSMMKRRLALARRLLRPDGVLIVTIDEHEVGHLSVLLEAIFPEYLRHMVTCVINPKGTGKHNFGRVDEYLFFCVPNTGSSLIRGVPALRSEATAPGEGALFYPHRSASATPTTESTADDEDEEDEDEEEENPEELDEAAEELEASGKLPFPVADLPLWYLRHARRRGSESGYRHQRWGQFYPILIDERSRKVVKAGDPLPLGQKPSMRKVAGLTPVWPIDTEMHERCWLFKPASMQERIDAGMVVLGRFNQGRKSWTLNIWTKKAESKKLKTVWWKRAHDAGTHGTTLLHRILGRRASFPFPKSVYAVADALAAVVRTRPDAVILDFFAGSGTTLHSTCLLNRLYGGQRRAILVTNNEVSEKTAARLARAGTAPGTPEFEREGICESVTWPRTKAALTGVRPDGQPIPLATLDGRSMSEGFPENAVYFKLGFLDPSDVSRGQSFEAIVPMLWLVAGARGQLDTARGGGKWFMPPGSAYAVLLREDHFSDFAARLRERPDITHAFLVTDSVEAFNEMAGMLADSATSASSPRRCVQLYKSYLDTFMINLEVPRAL